MRKFWICFLTLIASSSTVQGRPVDDSWIRTLHALRFADIIKAGFKRNCLPSSPLSMRPEYQLICERLKVIPDSVIESAALPFLKTHLSNALARKAVDFWSTKAGASLRDKMLVELETGVENQLTAADLILLGKRDGSDYGLALGNFAGNKLQSAAVVRAMYAYASAKKPEDSYSVENMRRSVAKFSSTLPIQVNLFTQVVGASLLDNRTIQYRYIFSKKEFKAKLSRDSGMSSIEVDDQLRVQYGGLEQALQDWAEKNVPSFALSSACTKQEQRTWLKNGVSLLHTYIYETGESFFETRVSIAQCQT